MDWAPRRGATGGDDPEKRINWAHCAAMTDKIPVTPPRPTNLRSSASGPTPLGSATIRPMATIAHDARKGNPCGPFCLDR